MKLLLLTSAILLLASCQQYRYDVTYRQCDNDIFSNTFKIDNGSGGFEVIATHVCDFSYTRTPISE